MSKIEEEVPVVESEENLTETPSQEEESEELDEAPEEETEEEGQAEPQGEEDPAQESAEETDEAPDEEAIIALKEKFFETLKKNVPDAPVDTEAKALEAAIERMDYLEDYYQKNTEANEAVLEVLSSQPELGEVIKDMAAGASFPEALARHIDLEHIEPEKGDPDYAKWKEAKAEREARIQKVKEFEKTLLANQQVSIQNIEEFRQEKELSNEERDQFVNQVSTVLKEIIEEGRITKDFLMMMYKALSFESATEESRRQGEIRGKNEVIDQKKAVRAKPDDGLPNISGQRTPDRPKTDKNAESILAWNKRRNRFD